VLTGFCHRAAVAPGWTMKPKSMLAPGARVRFQAAGVTRNFGEPD
jgi:hypothetical protein